MAKLTISPESGGQAPGQADAARGVPGQSSAVHSTPGQVDTARPPVSGESAPIPGMNYAGEQSRKQVKAKQESQAQSLFKGDDGQAAFGPDYGYKRIRFHRNDEINPYADAQDARFGFDPRMRTIIILSVVCVVVFLLTCLLPTNIFSVLRTDRTIGTLAGEFASSFQAFIAFFTNPNTMFGTHVFTVLVSVLAGAAMGLSGGVFQGAMKNALASPSTLGVTNGGTIGAIIYAVIIAPATVGAVYQGSISEYSAQVAQMDTLAYIGEMFGSFLSSLVGCVVVVMLVMSIALIAGRGKVSNASLVIAGQVFGAAIGVVVSWMRTWLTYYGDETALTVLTNAQSSTFTGSYNVISVAVFAIPLIICMVIIVLMSNRLTLLAFNEDEARTMGISVNRTRNFMVAICTIMTALVVSFCGAVGFVGFLIPHIARKMVGPNFRYLLPSCALMGGIMVCVIYYISVLGIPWIPEGSTGVITSVVGCAAFIVMAVRKRGAASGEWI